jgi:cytochrome c556
VRVAPRLGNPVHYERVGAWLRTLGGAPESRAQRSRQGDVHDPIVHAGADGSGWARHARCLAARGSPVRKARRRDPLFGRVAAMANGRVPFDAKAVADNAEIATIMSKLPYAGFVEGSDKGETRAKPEIWTEMDKFRAAAAKMQDEMAKLNVVAKAGNIDAIKAQVAETGKACKACHDVYRKE